MKQFWVNLELLEALSLKFRELKWWKTIGRERKINRKKWQKVFSHVNSTAYCRSIILVSHLEFSAPGFDIELIQNLKTAALQSRPLIQTNWRFILRTMANYFEIEPIKDRPKYWLAIAFILSQGLVSATVHLQESGWFGGKPDLWIVIKGRRRVAGLFPLCEPTFMKLRLVVI